MKRLLIVTDTYYPDSRATTCIIQRIAEGMQKKGAAVYALPLRKAADDTEYPLSHNGVSILKDVASAAENERRSLKVTVIDFLLRLLLKIKKGSKSLVKISNGEVSLCRWNKFVSFIIHVEDDIVASSLRTLKRNIVHTDYIKDAIGTNDITVVMSVLSPLWIHYVSMKASKKKGIKKVKWIPINLDPYAYDETISDKERRKRIREENRLYPAADHIVMLKQSAHNYHDKTYSHKISYIEIPNIRKTTCDEHKLNIEFDDKYIHCVFLGNLYWDVRNPEYMLQLFYELKRYDIRLYIIGKLSWNFPSDYMDNWIEKMTGSLVYLDRVSSEEAAAIINRADILINIGNITTNQCPSKVLDYISSGKPIIHIKRIEQCTSMPYLSKYPKALTIPEETPIDRELTSRIVSFIEREAGTRLEFASIRDAYSECTEDYVFQKVYELI